MPPDAASLLLLLCLLQIKHMFADFFLQTSRMLSGRGIYLHLGRAEHAGIHALGSVLVFLFFAAPIGFTAVIALLEWIVHYHIDYAKGRYTSDKQLTPQQAVYWRAMGADQAMHQFTYLAMAGAWIRFAF